MKWLIIIISLTSSFHSVCQSGKFCNNNGYNQYCIEFLNKGKFVMTTGSCVSNNYGKGNYEIKDKKLTLRFEPAPQKEVLSNITKIKSHKDSVKIISSLHDYETCEKIKDYSLIIVKPNSIDAEIQLNTATLFDTISVFSLYAGGYEEFKFEIYEPGYYFIEAELLRGEYLEGESTLNLINLNENYFTVEAQTDRGEIINFKYNKIKVDPK